MKNFFINPLKKSAVLGATLGVLGFKNSIPVHHGSQGCTAFMKNIMTQHFREIIPMQSTAIFNIALVMGDDSELLSGLSIIISKTNPEVLGLITTGIPQVRGDNIKYAIRQFYKKKFGVKTKIIPIEVSDFEGDAEQGFAQAVEAFVSEMEFDGDASDTVLIVTDFSLTCGDIDEIRYMVSSFGLKPVIIPDISESLGSSFNNYYKITPGGAEFFSVMPKPLCALGIGVSTIPVLEVLKDKGVKINNFSSLIGLKNVDKFIDFLSDMTGRVPDRTLLKKRGELVDTMLDSHFYFNKKKVALAAEPDLLSGLYYFVSEELGLEVKTAVTTYFRDDLSDIKPLAVGDLFEIEKDMGCVDILFCNSNGGILSEKYHNPIIKCGFPVKDEIGYPLKVFVGYRGTLNLLIQIANICLSLDEEKSYEYKNYKGVKYHESRILQH